MPATDDSRRPASRTSSSEHLDVSVVLPCLDEAPSVAACVHEARAAMAAAGLNGEVVVVDNGSTDGSPQLAAEAGARVVHEAFPGYSAAVRTGIEAARGEVVVMADADYTYDLSRVPDLVRPVLDDRADLVMGSRLDAATRRTMPLLHRFVGTPSLTFLIARACGGLAVRDTQSGYRAFRRADMLALGLRSTGMELTSEMLIRARLAGMSILEVGTGYRARLGGASKLDTWSDGWRNLQVISMLAPEVLLVLPGLVLLAFGSVMSLLGIVRPAGLGVGSLRWQPVFFSSILVVVGTQAVLAGAVLAHYSPLTTGATKRRFAFVGSPRLPTTCLRAGTAVAVAGLAIDGLLFFNWLAGRDAPSPGLGLAALAQSLIIVGASLASLGLVTRLILARGGSGAEHRPPGTPRKEPARLGTVDGDVTAPS